MSLQILLCEDLIIEILSWLAVKSLFYCDSCAWASGFNHWYPIKVSWNCTFADHRKAPTSCYKVQRQNSIVLLCFPALFNLYLRTLYPTLPMISTLDLTWKTTGTRLSVPAMTWYVWWLNLTWVPVRVQVWDKVTHRIKDL